MEQDFGIALTAKRVPQGNEFRAQRWEIIDFAIKNDDQGALLIGHRLGRMWRQIDHAQPAMGESTMGIRHTLPSSGPRCASERSILCNSSSGGDFSKST